MPLARLLLKCWLRPWVDAVATCSEVKWLILSKLDATAEASKGKMREIKFQLMDDIRKCVAQAKVLMKHWLIPAEDPNAIAEENK